tara:strand:- start:593 stop:1006 length:414 start_codon:yes stop_codon:yes gene_type:complete
MLISCSACNSKYLVNSAELKPNGRTVQCAKCGHNWFQTANIEDNIEITNFIPSKESEDSIPNNSKNLPSTYVKEQDPSILSSILVIFFTIFIIFIFWLIQNNGISFFVLIEFFIYEFYFNLKLIIKDLTSIFFQIFN